LLLLAASSSDNMTTWRGRLTDVEGGSSGDEGSGVGTAVDVRPCGSLNLGGAAGVTSTLAGLDVLGGEGSSRSWLRPPFVYECVRLRFKDFSLPLALDVDEGSNRPL
jgi:hypothetical protein